MLSRSRDHFVVDRTRYLHGFFLDSVLVLRHDQYNYIDTILACLDLSVEPHQILARVRLYRLLLNTGTSWHPLSRQTGQSSDVHVKHGVAQNPLRALLHVFLLLAVLSFGRGDLQILEHALQRFREGLLQGIAALHVRRTERVRGERGITVRQPSHGFGEAALG